MKTKKTLILTTLKSDLFQEITYAGIGCIIFIIIFSFLPKKAFEHPYRATIISLIVVSFFIIFIFLNQANPKNTFFKVNYKRNIILFSIFNFTTLFFIFFDTNYGSNGISGDNWYRTAYITRMAYSGYPQDFVYKDLSSFIPPLYWYCLALIARIFQIKPYRMIRYGFLFVYYIFPIILYEIWKKLYDKKIAFIITVLSFLFLGDIYSTDKMIAYMLIIPYFMYYYENCTNKTFSFKDYIVAGIIGSIIFCTYFLYFFMIPFYYFISLIQNKNEFKSNLKRIFLISLFLILFSSWFWLPLTKDILLIGFESHQNRYYSDHVFRVPFLAYFKFNILGIIILFGFFFLIRKYKEAREFKILGNILISIYFIYLIGYVGVLLHFPIMHVRFIGISFYLLIISFSIFYVKFFYIFTQNDILTKYKLKINLKQIEISLFISLFLFQSNLNLINIYDSAPDITAHKASVPKETIDKFKKLDYEDKVFLTYYYKVAAYLPIYLFLSPGPYFSHPCSLHNERIKFLEKLSECDSSKEFYKKIMDSKFGPIDFFYLEDVDNATHFEFSAQTEDFPEGREFYDIKFKAALFTDRRYFKKYNISGDIIYETIF